MESAVPDVAPPGIVEFLRNCFATQPNPPTCALLVE